MVIAALKKLKDSLFSVLPVLAVVLLLHFTKVSPFDNNELIIFCISVFLVVIGMWLFNIGAESSMREMGELVGSTVTKRKSIFMLVLIFFLFGIFITIAEPDLSVLADQVPGLPSWVLIASIGVGVGIFLVIASFRILFQKSLKLWLLAFYGLMFALCCLVDYSYIPLSLDSGGVTTGPITVPFILAIGVGLASSRAGNKSDADSFGLVAFSSIGPILVVLILSIFLRKSTLLYDVSEFSSSKAILTGNTFFEKSRNILNPLGQAFIGKDGSLLKVAISLLPVLLFFVVYELIFIKLSVRKLLGLLLGVVFVYVGLVLFLAAVEAGFLPIGQKLGQNLADKSSPIWLILVGAVLGLVAVFAEPAVHVLTNQVEQVSEGAVKKVAVLLCIAVGNAVAIAISMLRVKYGFNLFFIVVPGYFLAFFLSFLVPDIYSAIAFDSGGVVSGPMNSTFILPFAIGACYVLANKDPNLNPAACIMTDAFGTIAVVALMPLIMLQALGLTASIKEYNARRIALNRIKDEFDDQIIHF